MDNPSGDLSRALDELLPVGQRTGDEIADLCTAARESMRRRQANSAHGGAVLAALRARGLSWRQIEIRTHIPTRTARRWAEQPPQASDDPASNK